MSERLLVVGRELPARFHSEACLSASLPTLGQNRIVRPKFNNETRVSN